MDPFLGDIWTLGENHRSRPCTSQRFKRHRHPFYTLPLLRFTEDIDMAARDGYAWQEGTSEDQPSPLCVIQSEG